MSETLYGIEIHEHKFDGTKLAYISGCIHKNPSVIAEYVIKYELDQVIDNLDYFPYGDAPEFPAEKERLISQIWFAVSEAGRCFENGDVFICFPGFKILEDTVELDMLLEDVQDKLKQRFDINAKVTHHSDCAFVLEFIQDEMEEKEYGQLENTAIIYHLRYSLSKEGYELVRRAEDDVFFKILKESSDIDEIFQAIPNEVMK